jgi:hypothetical protein
MPGGEGRHTPEERVAGNAKDTLHDNSTIIFPAQFMTTVQEAIAMLNKDSASK